MSEAYALDGKTCPVCGKVFTVLWPGQWAYKRGNPCNPKYICSWKCLRTFDKGKEPARPARVQFEEVAIVPNSKISNADKEKAVQIALEGGNPLRFLETLNLADAGQMWYTIKKKLKAKDPETYAKLPKRYMPKQCQPKETVVRDGVTYEKAEPEDDPEGQKSAKPAPVKKAPEFEYSVTGIKTEAGEFRWFRRQGYLDWDPADGDLDTISMKAGDWKALLEILPKAMKLLGVKE